MIDEKSVEQLLFDSNSMSSSEKDAQVDTSREKKEQETPQKRQGAAIEKEHNQHLKIKPSS